MGAPVPPPFKIHLGINEAIRQDLKYWKKQAKHDLIKGLILFGGTAIGLTALGVLFILK